jgi:hypothetical protein
MEKAMKPVETLLGVTHDELLESLRGGATLAEVADAKGISRSDLVDAVAGGLAAIAPPGAEQLGDPTTLAERIVDHAGPAGSGPGDGRAWERGAELSLRAETALSGLADLLEMDANGLLAELVSGTSLVEIASRHDVSQDTLESFLGTSLGVDTLA